MSNPGDFGNFCQIWPVVDYGYLMYKNPDRYINEAYRRSWFFDVRIRFYKLFKSFGELGMIKHKEDYLYLEEKN